MPTSSYDGLSPGLRAGRGESHPRESERRDIECPPVPRCSLAKLSIRVRQPAKGLPGRNGAMMRKSEARKQNRTQDKEGTVHSCVRPVAPGSRAGAMHGWMLMWNMGRPNESCAKRAEDESGNEISARGTR